MALDINTPRGEETKRDELEAIRIYEAGYPGRKIVHTDKMKPCPVDLLIYSRETETVIAAVETKCRYDVTVEEFFHKPVNDETGYYGHWLITGEHVENGGAFAKQLFVPLRGFLYIVQSKVLLVTTLAHEDPETGKMDMPHFVYAKHTTTQATCNGGSATRLNYYFDMNRATRMNYKDYLG